MSKESGAPVEIPTLPKAVDKILNFAKDLALITESTGASTAQLARSLGVDRRQLYRWQNGALPKEPIVLLSLAYYADDIRAGRLSM